ncbi:MAG TPA: serine hydrolase domain-containing protein [Pyrinomonadaceae bacterium]|nr:serine hydrolase domain-containing protein [Pyrinomonadaceae bacterium]
MSIRQLFGSPNRRTIISNLFLLQIFIALNCNFIFGQTSDIATNKQIDTIFSKYNSKTSGAAVAVVKDGKVVFKKGYGTANLEYDIPISTKTVFNLASVSKQFTAFAVYLLEKQGKLSLEDDVRKYIPEIPDYGNTIKIKHLLAHTSGIKDQASLVSLAGWRSGDLVTNENILRFVSRQKELNFEPGTRFLYSNSGYTLLAEIVKRASGQTFAEFTKKNIFAPLEMNDTQFGDDHERIIKNRAESYELGNGVFKKKALNDSAVGASNLYTTVEDMAKWALNFENPKVGDAKLIRRFNEPSLLNNGERVVWAAIGDDIGYHAKGQIHWNYRGTKQISHGGHTAAFRTSFWCFPEQRVAVIVLSNDEHFEQLKNVTAIADLYLKNLKPNPISNPVISINKPLERLNTDLNDYEGKFYNDELEAIYTAKIVNGKLFLFHIRHGEIELNDAGKDKFTGRIEFPVEIEFVRNENGLITGFKVSNFGAKNVKFEKMK